MPNRKNTFKILAIVVLIGLVLAAAVGCQQGSTQDTADQNNSQGSTQSTAGQNSQQTQITGPKVLLFSADW